MALLANINRDSRRSRPFKPDDFDPYADDKKSTVVTLTKSNIGSLRAAMGK